MTAALVDPLRICPRCGEQRYEWEFSQEEHCDHCEEQVSFRARQLYDRERSRVKCAEWRREWERAEDAKGKRICRACGAELPRSHFEWRTSHGHRYQRWTCRSCRKDQYNHRWRGRNRRPDLPKPGRIPLRQIERDVKLEARAEPEPRRLPATRADCRFGPRPCLFVSCKYNNYLEVSKRGSIRLNFPELEPGEVEPGASCALDTADCGGATLEALGSMLNLTRERIRQIEVSGLKHFRAAAERHGIRVEDVVEDGPEAWRSHPRRRK